MNVPNNAWTRVGNAADTRQMIQNVGEVRIALIIAASEPSGVTLDLAGDGEHFIMEPYFPPSTFADIGSVSLWVRALGPKAGKLAVYAE